MLSLRGGAFLVEAASPWLIVPAMIVGTCKSLLILDKSARKNIDRLSQKEDGACLGGVYSATMWILIVVMMVLGRLLRKSGLPAELIGVLYVAIGWALFFSSRLLWGALRTQVVKTPTHSQGE